VSRPDFFTYAACAPWCNGHADPSVTECTTHWEAFGGTGDAFGGPVVGVVKEPGEAPVVAMSGMAGDGCALSPTQARAVADQLLRAADLAERPVLSPQVSRLLGLLMAGLAMPEVSPEAPMASVHHFPRFPKAA
jgi:hypothetical protein